MQRSITYCLVGLFISMLVLSCTKQNDIPSLRESFSKKDKNPFGTYVAYKEILHMFGGDTVRTETRNFQAANLEIYDTASLYIIICKNLYLTDEERDAMLSYVDAGNSLFIASENIDKQLLDTLHCKMDYNEMFDKNILFMRYTTVKLQDDPYDVDDTTHYGYFCYPFANNFSTPDTFYNKLGTNDDGKINFVSTNYGHGKIYFHCEPRALGNYFLLQRNNYVYWQQLLAFVPRNLQSIYWDDFYNKRNYPVDGKSISSLGYILQFPPLRWAFWLLILLLLTYILLGGKRRQRVIEVIAPNKNTTVAFAETMGRLYLQKKDNRNIADKIINYFYEQIRNQYFLNTSHINDDFITTLSRKSNVAKEKVEELFNTIATIQQNNKISDHQLLSLNQQIEKFNKNKI